MVLSNGKAITSPLNVVTKFVLARVLIDLIDLHCYRHTQEGSGHDLQAGEQATGSFI
jgi:hypothetical protein